MTDPVDAAGSGSGSSAVRLIAEREIITRLRSKAFRISTAAVVVGILALTLLPRLLGDADAFVLGTVGDDAGRVADLAAAAGEAVELDVRALPDRATAEAAVLDGEVDAALVTSSEALVDEGIPPGVEQLLTQAQQVFALDAALAEAGLGAEQREAALHLEPLEVRPLGEAAPSAFGFEALIGFGAIFILYMLLFFYGTWVAEGIIEEKTSRVIEVLLSTIRPWQLLGGKVLGIGLLGIVQTLVLATIAAAGLAWSFELSLTGTEVRTIAWVVAWYIPGYALYALLFAVSGALVPRQQDLQAAATPIYLVLIGGFLVMQYSLNDPTSTLSQVAGVFPFTAPLVQPLRTATGIAAPWEVPVGVLAIVFTIVALVPLTARLYRGGVLKTRTKTSLREAWRAADKRPGAAG
jgi:ABC-2 type transport system permease protein